MKNEYEVNYSTLILSQEGRKNSRTKVIEIENTFFITESCLKVIDKSCRYFGSSYEGRREGTKNLIKVSIKAPIIIEESKNFIFFPTRSPKSSECIWISYNNLEKYEKNKEKTRLIFKMGKIIDIPVSYEIVDNQITRCIKLEREILKRKENIKEKSM